MQLAAVVVVVVVVVVKASAPKIYPRVTFTSACTFSGSVLPVVEEEVEWVVKKPAASALLHYAADIISGYPSQVYLRLHLDMLSEDVHICREIREAAAPTIDSFAI